MKLCIRYKQRDVKVLIDLWRRGTQPFRTKGRSDIASFGALGHVSLLKFWTFCAFCSCCQLNCKSFENYQEKHVGLRAAVTSLALGHWGTCPFSSFGHSVHSAAAVSLTVKVSKITKKSM